MENEVQNNNQIPQENPTPVTINSLVAKARKNIKLLVVLACIVFLVLTSTLIGILYSNKLKKMSPTTTQQPQEEAYGSVLLTPVSVTGTPGKKSTIDVVLNTDARKISGIVIGIKYNPNILEDVTIIPFKDPTSALGYSLRQTGENIYNAVKGESIATLELPDGVQDLAGSGKIAEVSFTVKPLKVAVLSTSIELTTLTGFLSSSQGEHANLTKNQTVITLPAGLKYLSPTPAGHK